MVLSSVGRARGQSGDQPAGRAASWAASGRQNPRTSQCSSTCVPGASTYLAPRISLPKLHPQVAHPLNRTLRLRGPAGWWGSALGTLAPLWLTHSSLLWVGKGRVWGHASGAPGPSLLPLLAEPRACVQDQKVQGGDVRSRSGAPGTACALRGSLLPCMDFGCVACSVPWRRSWFQTPLWKARPMAAHLGSGRRASRAQLTCKCSALYLHCQLKTVCRSFHIFKT